MKIWKKKAIFLIMLLSCIILFCFWEEKRKNEETVHNVEAQGNEQNGGNSYADGDSGGINAMYIEDIREETDSEDWVENTEASGSESKTGRADSYEQSAANKGIEKGYNLPVSGEEKEEAETDGKEMMELIADIYKEADKGDSLNDVLPEEALCEMAEKIGETGNCVIVNKVYSSVEPYENFEKFLRASETEKEGTAVLYKILTGGCISREKYIYHNHDMYVITANFMWSDDEEPVMSYITHTKMEQWEYTKKGIFCYKLCVPQPPEVTEIVDGSCMLRVRPMTEENREMSEKCVLGVTYQGNNLLCSDWDAGHLENLDYNGLFENLYAMKYQKSFQAENYPAGIPKELFEELMIEYLPVTETEIQEYAAFDEKNQTYLRAGMYTPTYFETSVPEVTNIQEHEDGTVTLRVDAVCRMALDEAVITHELTVRFSEDGSFQYLGNKMLNGGIENIPEYQYRIARK